MRAPPEYNMSRGLAGSEAVHTLRRACAEGGRAPECDLSQSHPSHPPGGEETFSDEGNDRARCVRHPTGRYPSGVSGGPAKITWCSLLVVLPTGRHGPPLLRVSARAAQCPRSQAPSSSVSLLTSWRCSHSLFLALPHCNFQRFVVSASLSAYALKTNLRLYPQPRKQLY